MSVLKHESARGHVTGRAAYADELAMPSGTLSLYPVQSPHAHARILSMDCTAAERMPGVWRVLTAKDVPGENDTGPILHDELLFPTDIVNFHAQAVAWVLADSETQAQRAAQSVRIEYEALPACLSIQQAIMQDQFHQPRVQIVRGDVDAALSDAPVCLHGELQIIFIWRLRRAGCRSTAKAWYRSLLRHSTPPRPRLSSRACLVCPRIAWSAEARGWAVDLGARKPRLTRLPPSLLSLLGTAVALCGSNCRARWTCS